MELNCLEVPVVYSIVVGLVIVALGLGSVVYSFWHEGSPLPGRRRHHNGAS